jgi:aryl-alcohol dehydrogenase-like predicted oxidoreductase
LRTRSITPWSAAITNGNCCRSAVPRGSARSCGAHSAGAGLPAKSAAARRFPKTADCISPPVEDERLYRVVDALDEIAAETGKAVPQIALNWLMQRPTVSSVIIGARNEEQLRQNLGALGWSLTADQMARLDRASAVTAPYPYFPYERQDAFARLNPPLSARVA